jgi:N-acetylgalactosamine-6-sulfatase
MTGQFPARLGVHGHFATHEMNRRRGMPNFLDPAATTYTRILRDAGYRVGHFGKWHLGNGPGAPEPFVYGIDECRVNAGNGPQLEFRREAWEPGLRCRSSAFIVNHAIRFIEENKTQPFLVNIWLNDTHAILDPSEEQLELYQNLKPQFVGDYHWGAPAIYYSVVTEADRQIGQVLTKLDQLGLSENTVIIFSSDNGPEDILVRNASHSGVGSPGPFRGRKRSLYEGGVRVPFLLRWPAGIAEAGVVNDITPLCAVDLFPTFCRLAGVSPPMGWPLDGEDMSDVFRGSQRQRRTPLMWEWRFRIIGHPLNQSPMLAIREGDWKLLINPVYDRVELYDIPNDPMELNNLAQQYPERVAELAPQVLDWHATLPKGPIDPGAGSNAYPWPRCSSKGGA